MGKVAKAAARGPSQEVAKALLKKRAAKQNARKQAESAEAAFRKSGGYGKGGKTGVSIHDAPKGGIEKSPAYQKLLTRCELDAKGKPPPAQERNGAPVKGGFPLKDYPVNVIVDAWRVPWLPDDWAQVMKNTGPGGVYHGWMSPEGKFCYHRARYPSSMEEQLGRKLSFLDGINGIVRSATKIVAPGADKKFLQQCLTPAEHKHIAPKEAFLFGIVSAFRADNDEGVHGVLTVQGLFKADGIQPIWYVANADDVAKYKKLGLNAKVGGKLTPARNMVLDDAKKKNLVAVEVSDDISKWIYFDCPKQNYKGETDFKRQNNDVRAVPKHSISPLAAAQFILAKMRADPGKPHLGGVFPTSNAAMTLGLDEIGKQHFILGDFFVALPASRCRFDNAMTLKEDYDYSCSHIKQHGCVMRINRMFLQVKHETNAGGAVQERDAKGEKERKNIAILQTKWPGVFRINTRRKGEADTQVTMNWNGYGKETAAKKQSASAMPKDKKGALKQKAMPKVDQEALWAQLDARAALRSREQGLGKGKAMPKVKKGALKQKGVLKVMKAAVKAKATGDFSPDAILQYIKKDSDKEYIAKRASRCNGKTVHDVIGMMFAHANGEQTRYGISDLKYDFTCGRLRIAK